MSTEPNKAGGRRRNRAAAMLVPYFYVGPALIIMAVITFYPLFYQIYLSFLNLKATNLLTGPRFVGLSNYEAILGSMDSEFYMVTVRTVAWTVINVLFHLTLGVFL